MTVGFIHDNLKSFLIVNKMSQELKERAVNKNIELLIEKKNFVNDYTFFKLVKNNIGKDKIIL